MSYESSLRHNSVHGRSCAHSKHARSRRASPVTPISSPAHVFVRAHCGTDIKTESQQAGTVDSPAVCHRRSSLASKTQDVSVQSRRPSSQRHELGRHSTVHASYRDESGRFRPHNYNSGYYSSSSGFSPSSHHTTKPLSARQHRSPTTFRRSFDTSRESRSQRCHRPGTAEIVVQSFSQPGVPLDKSSPQIAVHPHHHSHHRKDSRPLLVAVEPHAHAYVTPSDHELNYNNARPRLLGLPDHTLQISPSLPPSPPMVNTLRTEQYYWTSTRTRRKEYAEIDAASRGVKGWMIHHVVPDWLTPRKFTKHLRFDDDSGSVIRHRLDLDDDDDDDGDGGGDEAIPNTAKPSKESLLKKIGSRVRILEKIH